MRRDSNIQAHDRTKELGEATITDSGGASVTILSEDQFDKPTLQDFDFNQRPYDQRQILNRDIQGKIDPEIPTESDEMSQRRLSFPELTNAMHKEQNHHQTPLTRFEAELEEIGRDYITSPDDQRTDREYVKHVQHSKSTDSRQHHMGALEIGTHNQTHQRKSITKKLKMSNYETNDKLFHVGGFPEMDSQKFGGNTSATKASSGHNTNKLMVTIQKADGSTEVKEVQDAFDFDSNDFSSKQRRSLIHLKNLKINTDDNMQDNFRKLSKPMVLTNFFVNHPCLWLLMSTLALAIISGIVFYFDYFAVSPISNRDFLIWDDPKTINYDKSNLARSTLVAGASGSGQLMPLQSSIEIEWTMFLIYSKQPDQKRGTNAWSREMIQAIREMEEPVRFSSDFQKFCLADQEAVIPVSPRTEINPTFQDIKCARASFLSPVDLLYYKGFLPKDFDTITQEQLDEALLSVIQDEKSWENFKSLFDQEVSATNLDVKYMRSQLLFAGPLQYETGQRDVDGNPIYARYESMADRFQEQNQLVTDFQVRLSEALEHGNQNYHPEVQRNFFSLNLYRFRFMEVAQGDTAYAVFSVLFVFFYIWFHLRSLFLGISAMLVILISFPVTQFIYRGIMRVEMYTGLNQLIIFIVLGIAADNIFVFCDAWRQSEHNTLIDSSQHGRMAYSFKRASKAIAVTASTTSIAFAANVASPIVPIKAFGLQAAAIIPVNFILVVMMMPSIQIIYERYFKDKCKVKVQLGQIQCCCRKRKSVQAETIVEDKRRTSYSRHVEQDQEIEPSESIDMEEPVHLRIIADQVSRQKRILGSPAKQAPRQSLVVNELRKSSMGLLSPAKPRRESMLRGENQDFLTKCFGGSFNQMTYKFRYVIIVALVLFGVCAAGVASQMGPLSKAEEMMPADNPLVVTQKIMLNEFKAGEGTPSSLQIQITWGIKGMDRSQVGAWDAFDVGELQWDQEFTVAPVENQLALMKFCTYLLEESNVVADGVVNCWIKNMDTFVRKETKNRVQIPIQDEDEFMRWLLLFTEKDAKGIDAYRSQKLGFINDPDSKHGVKLQYMVVSALSIGNAKDSREFKMPIYEKWESDVNDFAESAPKGLGNVYQVASFYWSWMETEKAFFTNAMQGMIISIGFACVVIFIATRNWIVTFYAIHCVGFICAAEMALMHLRGYEMGVAESVGTIMVIGFSVDYVVHLAAHYVHSAAITRYYRTKESIGEMGVSIFSGAMTTIGSAAFLFGGQMAFFQKFAFMISTTICLALAYSLVYYIALSHGFGPEGHSGDVMYIIKSCVRCCKRTKEIKRQSSELRRRSGLKEIVEQIQSPTKKNKQSIVMSVVMPSREHTEHKVLVIQK